MKALARSLVFGSSLLAIVFFISCTTPPPLDTSTDETEASPSGTGFFGGGGDEDIPAGERYAVPYSGEFDRYGHRNPYGWR